MIQYTVYICLYTYQAKLVSVSLAHVYFNWGMPVTTAEKLLLRWPVAYKMVLHINRQSKMIEANRFVGGKVWFSADGPASLWFNTIWSQQSHIWFMCISIWATFKNKYIYISLYISKFSYVRWSSLNLPAVSYTRWPWFPSPFPPSVKEYLSRPAPWNYKNSCHM